MENCKKCSYCIYAEVDGKTGYWCKYNSHWKLVPFPVFTKGGTKKCECFKDFRYNREKFAYPKKGYE